MAKFDAENYVSAHERIQKFWNDHKNGAITTTVVKDAEGEVAGIHASVFRNQDDQRPAGSGHGYVYEFKSKAIEKAETIAVGRALAMMGYEVEKGIASEEEMEDFEETTSKKRGSLGGGRKKKKRSGGLGGRKNKAKEVEEDDEEEDDELDEESSSASSVLAKARAKRRKLMETDEDEVDGEEEDDLEIDEEDDDEDELAKFKTANRKRG